MIEYNPWELIAANGCVPDLTSSQTWPTKKASKGKAGSKEGTLIKSVGKATTTRLPEIVVYEHIDYGGHQARTNLNWYYVGDWWNDKISSITVVSGTWRFYEHWHYEGGHWDLGPGYYRWVEDAGIPNDVISSFQVIAY